METPFPWLLFSGTVIFLITRAIYRVCLHPLSKIPGPKLAATSYLYEFYYDICIGGRFLFEIENMHRQYGPIVRINPHEISISDPSFYDEIYAPSSRRRDRDPKWVPGLSLPTSMIATVNHDLHRSRRAIPSNFFSKRSVIDLTPMIEERIRALIQIFEDFRQSQRPVQLDNAFAALTADIITYYSYGKLWGFVEDADFRSDVRRSVSETSRFCHVNRLFPFIPPLIRLSPKWLKRRILSGKSSLIDFQESVFEAGAQSTEPSGTEKSELTQAGRTIFHKLNDPTLPAAERSKQRLEEESLFLLGAGTETTGSTLTVAAYYVYQDPVMLGRLRAELKPVLPRLSSSCAWSELEQLPYLTAVLNESLRVTTPILSRTPRVAPDETLIYKGYTIPPCTSMSTSSYFVHRNPLVFPDPDKFDPNRWIHSEGSEKLDRHLTAFGRGSGMCLGINLAYAELYMALAYIFRFVDLEICNTGPRDMDVTREYIIGITEHGERRAFAKVIRILEE
ncbi:benzoate 4-monooxygenase cytochrome P450 [Aspergillus karnatakaensis]|uniref:cytochrome P450 n=1 Tax=Aspergillus karnatakaensis TaxID=1810916 RepID=UPI003CCE23E6